MEELKVLLPGWETVRCIGSGSSGRVYELKKKDEYGGDYSSALKVITVPSTQKEYDEMKSAMSEFAMRAKLRDKVEEISSEYRVLGTLRGHPNIVNCEDQMIVPHEDDLGWDIYIRMELLCSLPEYAAANGLKVSEVVKLGVDMCSALELCRSSGIIHRDIKPHNIFVSRYGSYKLGDFGVAKASGIRNSSDMAGTYSYMAPEVYKGREYDERVDIYSLGMVLYYLLNEQRGPFLPYDKLPTQEEIAAAQLKRFNGEALPSPKYGTQALKKLVLKACSYNADDRFLTPTEMKQELLRLSGSVPEPMQADSDATVREERRERAAPVMPDPAPVFTDIKKDKPKPKPEEKPKKDTDSGGSGAAITVLAVIVALLCAAIVVIIVFGSGDNPKPKPSSSTTPVESVEPTKELRLTAVVLSSPRLLLTAGDDAALTVSTIPETPESEDIPELIWKSSDTSVAKVDADGKVSAVAEGTATIMVYVKDKMELYDECMIEVLKPVITSLEIIQMPTRTVYGLGEQLDTTDMVLKAYYNNGEEKEISDPNDYTVTCNMDGIGSRKAVVTYDGAETYYTVRISLFG